MAYERGILLHRLLMNCRIVFAKNEAPRDKSARKRHYYATRRAQPDALTSPRMRPPASYTIRDTGIRARYEFTMGCAIIHRLTAV